MTRLGLDVSPAELERMGYRVVNGVAVSIEEDNRRLQAFGDALGAALSMHVVAHKYGLAPNGRPYKSKTEARYAEYLDVQQRTGLIREWRYEELSLYVGHDVRYVTDFLVLPNVLTAKPEVHEVKSGYYWGVKAANWQGTGKTKFRVAAMAHQWLTFKAIAYEQGTWRTVETHNA